MTEAGDMDRARRRAKYLTGLLWHIGAFVIINGAFWALDLAGGGGLDWAFWISAMWGLALAFHLLAFLIDGRDLETRRAERYVERERRRRAA